MFDWLVEGRSPVYLVLSIAVIILLAVWSQTRRRRWLIAVAVVAGLVGLYALLDVLIETPYEQMVRKVNEMAAVAHTRDPASLRANLADDFNFHGMTKDDFLRAAEGRIRSGEVRDVLVWDFDHGAIAEPDRRELVFLLKVKTTWTRDELFFRCLATFMRGADGQWRMQRIELFDPTRNNERIDVRF
jgi:hypothetical protein